MQFKCLISSYLLLICALFIHITVLSVYSSDDYYEYGHSGESYDSYGEFPPSVPPIYLVSIVRISISGS